MRIYENFGKRAFDLFFSFAGILLFSPLFLLLAFLIKLDSKGCVFFMQKRMGVDGRLFFLLKFRTMHTNLTKEKLLYEPGVGDRITPLGKILRKIKLDELPQIINVLEGDMSFVGPRPEVPKYKSFYSGKYRKILSVKPGITDRASVKYRNEEALLSQSDQPERLYDKVILPDKLKINLEYVEKSVSFKEDIRIMIETGKQIYFR